MLPKFETLPEMKIAGLGTKFISILSPHKNNMTVLPALWQQFLPKRPTIPHLVGKVDFGLVEMLPEDDVQHLPAEGEMFYIAGAEVSDFTGIPAGLLQRTIPAGNYARFTHKGGFDALDMTMSAIYAVWLPTSGVVLRNAPHLERYDERFHPSSPDSEFDIFLPVE